jgi:hypothetical protein
VVTVCWPTLICTVRWRRVVRTNFLIDQPAASSTKRVMTASAAKTMVRWL